MIKVGITGQSGFIGSHLHNFLGLKEDIERIPFQDDYFTKERKLNEFTRNCDVIVHLAALNRHNDPKVIYDTNIKLVYQLLNACNKSNSKPHFIFSSSVQENKDNLYGKSKLEGRQLFENWASKNKVRFSGLIIPNVYGPFGHPFFNSVIATFSYQLTHQETPEIHVDGLLRLIYVNELIEIFYKFITGEIESDQYLVQHSAEKRVSEILEVLKFFKSSYFDNGIIPDISNHFQLALFNTFRSYIDVNKFPNNFTKHSDQRGTFVEVVRANSQGQVSYSITKPGYTRGNHFHTRKVERFSVIDGEALIQLRRIGTNKILKYHLNGSNPSFVDIPIWYTHSLRNIGQNDLLTLFWINEPYNPLDPDTFYENV